MKLKEQNLFLSELTKLIESGIKKNVKIEDIDAHLKEYFRDKKKELKPKKRTRKKKIVRPPLYISDSSNDELELVDLK